jgi:hypothetical protein
MPFPNQDYSERGYLLAHGCKDLAGAIAHEEQLKGSRVPEPPITRYVSLPEKVSLGYVVEISGRSLLSVMITMGELRIHCELFRPMDFADAARILRQYGIGAVPDTGAA